MLQIIQRIGTAEAITSHAQANVPAIFYHFITPWLPYPFDSPDKIDYVKLTKMTKWIYETGWRVAQSAKRPFNYWNKKK
jgi:hypothetical protein